MFLLSPLSYGAELNPWESSFPPITESGISAQNFLGTAEGALAVGALGRAMMFPVSDKDFEILARRSQAPEDLAVLAEVEEVQKKIADTKKEIRQLQAESRIAPSAAEKSQINEAILAARQNLSNAKEDLRSVNNKLARFINNKYFKLNDPMNLEGLLTEEKIMTRRFPRSRKAVSLMAAFVGLPLAFDDLLRVIMAANSRDPGFSPLYGVVTASAGSLLKREPEAEIGPESAQSKQLIGSISGQ